MSCRACDAGELVHDDDDGSLVCIVCGTLADPTRVVLADHHGPSSSSYSTPRRWHLAQTKQDRERRNAIAMSTFINAVLSRLNSPGLSPRAEAIFTQAMAKGKYRWGRRAKRVAGAAIAIALREAHKSDSLRDIAFLLDDTPLSLARALQSVLSLLDFSLASTEPAVHLPILHAHLHSILHPVSHLPSALVAVLTPLSLHAAVHTATSLSQIIAHHSPPLPIASLPTPPTACALLLLGLEAEARAPLPHLGQLARSLASRFALSPGVVSSRYNIICNLIEEWIRHVPWLDKFVYKGKGRGAAARSKVPKRTIVAKGIKDVVQFHEEISLARFRNQNHRKLELHLDVDPGDAQDQDDHGDNDAVTPTVASSTVPNDPYVIAPPPRERLENLLQPFSDPSLDGATASGEISLLTHLLTCPPDQLPRARGTPPTRLELLVAARGGSTVREITDQELFADGELEGLLRSEQEREALGPLFELNWGRDTPDQDTSRPKRVASETKRGVKRIDMDALARLLGGRDSGTEDSPDSENGAHVRSWDDYMCRSPGHQIDFQGTESSGSDWRHSFLEDEDGDVFGDDRYEQEL